MIRCSLSFMMWLFDHCQFLGNFRINQRLKSAFLTVLQRWYCFLRLLLKSASFAYLTDHTTLYNKFRKMTNTLSGDYFQAKIL